MSTPQPNSLDRRLTELEIRSEERRSDVATLEEFVRGYENRIAALETQVRLMREQMVENGDAGERTLEDDLPPHY